MSRPVSRNRPPAPTRQVAAAGYSSAPQRTVGTFVKGVGSLLLLIGFIVGVPYVLVRIGAYPTSISDPAGLWRSLTGPDLTGRGVFTVLAGMIWIGWVWFTLSVLRETAAAIFSQRRSGHRPRRYSRLGARRPVRQRTMTVKPAAVLVAAVVAMFITTPLIAGNASPALASPSGTTARTGTVATATQHPTIGPAAPAAHTSTRADSAATHTAAQPTAATGPSARKASATSSASTVSRASTASKSSTVTYTVRRYDTLWSIADRQLGDPTRYHEIVALNPHLKQDMTIHSGDRLTLPQNGTQAAADTAGHAAVAEAPATTASSDTGGPVVHETVELGDTLSEISADHGVQDWQTVWEANKGKVQPGGKHFTNPDHIEVGWDITIPTSATAAPAPDASPASSAEHQPAPATESAAPAPGGPAAPSADDASPAPSSETPATPSALGSTAPSSAEAATGTPNHRPDPQAREQTALAPPSAAGVAPSAAGQSAQGAQAGQAGQAGQEQAPVSHVAMTAGYAAGGTVLAAGIWAALVLVRRQQWRDRRPGRTVASTPEPLIPLERAIVTAGAPSSEETARIDQVLRRVGASDIPVLHVAAVQLTRGDITIHLSEPAALPAPWRQPTDTADTTDTDTAVQGPVGEFTWTFPAGADPSNAGPDPSVVDAIAPFPTLVHIGSDATSAWLLNLEQAGTLVLTGDRDRCLALARVMSAQLGVNAWADIVAVTMLGFGQELVETSPTRLRHAPIEAAEQVLRSATATAASTADSVTEMGLGVVEARRIAAGDEAWPVHVLLATDLTPTPKTDTIGQADTTGHTDTAGEAPDSPVVDRLGELLEVVQQRSGLTGAAVVVVQGQAGVQQVPASGSALVASLDASGTMTLDGVGLTVQAIGWDDETSRGVGELMRHLRNAPDQAVPAAKGDQPWQQVADAAGALRPDLVEPRSTPTVHDSQRPVGATMLPLADEVYVDVAATTTEDLEVLAPTVSTEVVERVMAADPTLDQDLADWFDQDSHRAKLTVLGPLMLRTQQPPPKRAPYYAELAAYLAFREHGTTAEEFMAAFSLSPATSRNYLSTLREYLGTDPTTGMDYMPSAKTNRVAKARGVGVYIIEGILVDADLFRRLRVRGQARGAAGMEDYATALRLVTGAPFSHLRDDGGTWLLEGDRIDHHLSLAIVDVAHALATSALAAGDTVAARAAVDIARQAAPDEETVRLDAAAVDVADGRTAEARRTLREDVCNRSDDGEPPLDLNPRTRQILARHRDWLIAS